MKSLPKFLKTAAIGSCLAMCAMQASGQMAYNYAKAGDDYYRKGNYYSAAQYYEKYLTGNTAATETGFDPYAVTSGSKGQKAKSANRSEIVFRTAESYRLLNNPVKAEPFYRELVSSSASSYPLARYWFAKMLRANSKFDEAEAEFNSFLNEYASNDEFKADATKELKNLQFRAEQIKRTDLNLFSVSKMGVNSDAGNSAPFVQGSELYFSSTRHTDSDGEKGPHINRVFKTGLSDGSSAALVEVPQAADEHLERPALSPDGQRMYITRWYIMNGGKVAGIYMSTLKGDKWSDPVKLTGVNSDGYNSQQPFVTSDGKHLYYASDKPGGFGKMDLYIASLDAEGMPQESNNLGASINTTENDEAPYYFSPSQTLVFSTNGRVGMGGMDFFQSKGDGTSWEEPVNMGYPINSVKEDKYMASAGTRYLLDSAYFSSDRESDCCLQLFAANKLRPKRNIAGKIIDCLTAAPMADVTITASDASTESPVTSGNTDAFGRYMISIDQDQKVKVLAEHEGYTPKVIDLSKMDPTDTLINISVCLEPPQKPFEPVEDKPAVIPNIYFDYDKATLRAESYPVMDSIVGLMERYPNMAIEVGGHTDNIAGEEYNQKLSEARAKAFVDYVVSKGIDAARMTWKGYGESMPIAPNTLRGKDNPDGRQKNRRTEIKVIHY